MVKSDFDECIEGIPQNECLSLLKWEDPRVVDAVNLNKLYQSQMELSQHLVAKMWEGYADKGFLCSHLSVL